MTNAKDHIEYAHAKNFHCDTELEKCLAFLHSQRSAFAKNQGEKSRIGPVEWGKSKYSECWEEVYFYFPISEREKKKWNKAVGNPILRRIGFDVLVSLNRTVSFYCQTGSLLYDVMVETNFFKPHLPTKEWHQLFGAEVQRRKRAGALPSI